MGHQIGNRYYKIDFHVHTPASSDYKDKQATPKDIVEAALAAGLDAIVITDHNTAALVDAVTLAAAGSELVVFPGIEITANGGHVLAVFDPLTPESTLNEVLLLSGISAHQRGSENSIGHDLLKVIETIAGRGIAIGAHADGPKGFLTTTTQGQAAMRVYNNTALTAMELIDLTKVSDYNQGKVSGYPRRMAVIQGSDAHSLAKIGARATYVKMQKLTLSGLRQAFDEPILRIRFDERWKSELPNYIESLEVSQGFLAGQKLLFNPGLNCLVGGAGSGKSTVLEFLRFALDQVSSIEAIQEDCTGKLRDMAQQGATISVVVSLESGERLKVSRTFDELENSIEVIRLSDNQVLQDVDVRRLIPVHAYSQGEAIAISRNPLAQLDLIDKHINVLDMSDEIGRLYADLDSQVDGLTALTIKASETDECNRSLNTIHEQIRELTAELEEITKAQRDPVVSSHQFWISESHIFADLIKNTLPKVMRDVTEKLDSIDLDSLVIKTAPGEMPNQDLLDECHELLSEIELARQKAKSELVRAVQRAQTGVAGHGTVWKERYGVHLAAYQTRRLAQGHERALAINNRLEVLKKEERRFQMQLSAATAAQRTLTTQLQKRRDALSQLDNLKARIATLRDRKAKEIVKAIGETIRLKVIRDGNRTSYEDTLSDLMRGTHAQRETVRRICDGVHPRKLVELLRAGGAEQLEQVTGVGAKWIATLISQSSSNPEFVFRLESIPVEDRLDIGLRIEAGKYRPLEKLSTGQKATVIVLLSMVEGRHPILFDQPEDALYTPFIYTDVVRTLKTEKDQRQFILATHNPNISIAADLDLGIVLDSTATQVGIATMGALDDGETQKLMVLHLEGGPEAFLSRQRKLGISRHDSSANA